MSEDRALGDGSSPGDGLASMQQCQSVEEWRSCEQVENGTPSTSPPYWDSDDDDDSGMLFMLCFLLFPRMCVYTMFNMVILQIQIVIQVQHLRT